MWELDPRRLGFRGSRQGIAVGEVLARVMGAILEVLWPVMGVGEWPGGEVRSGRSGRCALVCRVHGFAVGVRQDVC